MKCEYLKYIKLDVTRKPSNGSINYNRSRECLSKKLQQVQKLKTNDTNFNSLFFRNFHACMILTHSTSSFIVRQSICELFLTPSCAFMSVHVCTQYFFLIHTPTMCAATSVGRQQSIHIIFTPNDYVCGNAQCALDKCQRQYLHCTTKIVQLQ